MLNVFKKVLAIIASMIFAYSLQADEQTELKNRFLNKIDEIITIVDNKNITKEQRNGDIVKAILPMFDFELMAKLSLGNTWKDLSQSDAKRFVELYVERMKQSYSAKIDAYEDEKVEIKSIDRPKSNRIAFVTDLVGKAEKLEIVYKFHKPGEKERDKEDWLVYDVEIMGVSILKTDRAQFKEFLRNKSIKELMQELSKQL